MIQVWRTTKRKYADHAFNGEGARLAGGRFNRKGTPLVYTSGSLSLSILEVLTQVIDYQDLIAYVAVPASVDEQDVKVLRPSDLPDDWRALPAPESTRALGTRWADAQESLVLQVPSVVLPAESNYLINPGHPAFSRIRIGTPRDLDLDTRLLKS